MPPPRPRLAPSLLIALSLIAPSPLWATDVDGPDDCQKTPQDFGDAPEGVQAYPGILGRFPTCTAAGPVGTQETVCDPISSAPGAAGYVRHVHIDGITQYWLGCIPTNQGIDSELDGKVNDTGLGESACASGLAVDCTEAAFGLTFGQDECYGSTDAGILSPVSFLTCTKTSVPINVWNCGPRRQVYLNILVDWNQDGDWNDNYQCGPYECVYEWAVKNAIVMLDNGCNSIPSPSFVAGPNAGEGWMRVTISDDQVNDDFPWAGSATMANDLANGETEDYPVTIEENPNPCPSYMDWGDAPEGIQAYSDGTIGHFPTCWQAVIGGGTQEIDPGCTAVSSPPGFAGYVEHLATPSLGDYFWLGCGNGNAPGVDDESDGKVNVTGGPFSDCDSDVPVDCSETAFGLTFGQDECYGDPSGDAGITSPLVFNPCTPGSVTFNAYNCGPTAIQVYLNILVDWNQDGDWNDVLLCSGSNPTCAPEWAVQNVQINLPPGCSQQVSPSFMTGPNAGEGWLRITLTSAIVNLDFPWAGSFSVSTLFYGGETEDYPVTIEAPCGIHYRDFGDAPENFDAYPGVPGHFPTCALTSPTGDQDLECGAAVGTPPGPAAGWVEHRAFAADPYHFWLGCEVDDEFDGKTNPGGPAGSPSLCDAGVVVDCVDVLGALAFGQDECVGGPDAGITAPVSAKICSLLTIPFKADLCENATIPVYLNVLADWNRDGDWNDNVACKDDVCSLEWPVKNQLMDLRPGCNDYLTPQFATGPFAGPVWIRMSLSANPAPNDFPWAGTTSIGYFSGGETEDYMILLTPETTDVPASGWSRVGLSPVRPNPARDQAMIEYALPRAADVSLSVYDLAGRRVAQLERGAQSMGVHHLNWNFRDDAGRDVPLGYYVIKLGVGNEVLTRRVIRVK